MRHYNIFIKTTEVLKITYDAIIILARVTLGHPQLKLIQRSAAHMKIVYSGLQARALIQPAAGSYSFFPYILQVSMWIHFRNHSWVNTTPFLI